MTKMTQAKSSLRVPTWFLTGPWVFASRIGKERKVDCVVGNFKTYRLSPYDALVLAALITLYQFTGKNSLVKTSLYKLAVTASLPVNSKTCKRLSETLEFLKDFTCSVKESHYKSPHTPRFERILLEVNALQRGLEVEFDPAFLNAWLKAVNKGACFAVNLNLFHALKGRHARYAYLKLLAHARDLRQGKREEYLWKILTFHTYKPCARMRHLKEFYRRHTFKLAPLLNIPVSRGNRGVLRFGTIDPKRTELLTQNGRELLTQNGRFFDPKRTVSRPKTDAFLTQNGRAPSETVDTQGFQPFNNNFNNNCTWGGGCTKSPHPIKVDEQGNNLI